MARTTMTGPIRPPFGSSSRTSRPTIPALPALSLLQHRPLCVPARRQLRAARRHGTVHRHRRVDAGPFQQVNNAFGQVEDSFKFFASSWTTIISLISVYKRLRLFESHIPKDAPIVNDYDDPRYLAAWHADHPPTDPAPAV